MSKISNKKKSSQKKQKVDLSEKVIRFSYIFGIGLSIVYFIMIILQVWLGEKFLHPTTFVKISLTYGALCIICVLTYSILKEHQYEKKLKEGNYIVE